MTTEARIHANRLNAQKSTGPKTPQGKAVVSQNALQHGLSARRDVITTESQEEFDLHRDAFLAELDPQTPMESILADRIVSLSWRLKRADLIQNQTIDVLAKKDATNPLAKIAKSLGLSGLPIPQPDPADSNPDLILGRIALKDFSNERVLDRLLMYERRIEHSLFRTTLELQRLRLLRNLEPPHSQQDLAPGFTGGPPSTEPNNTPALAFSRRRHDDALTPNSPTRPGIPIRQEPIINNQSSIVNIESTPEPPAAYLAPGPAPAGSTDQNNAPEPAQTITQYPASSIQNHTCIMQNKPNPQNPQIPTNPFLPKTYTNISPRPTRKNKPNQTQFIPSRPPYLAPGPVPGVPTEPNKTPRIRPNHYPLPSIQYPISSIQYPISSIDNLQSPSQYAIRHPTSDIRNTTYKPCTTAAGQS